MIFHYVCQFEQMFEQYSSLVSNNLYHGNSFTTFFCKWNKIRSEARGQGTYVEEVATPKIIVERLVEEENPFSGCGYQSLQCSTT